jgi:hypothetical protein
MFTPLFRLLLSLLALMTGLAVPGVAVAQNSDRGCNRAAAEVARSEAGSQDAADSAAEVATITAPAPCVCAALPAAANALPLPVVGNLPARAGFIVQVDRAHE